MRALASATVIYSFFYVSRTALDVVKQPLIDGSKDFDDWTMPIMLWIGASVASMLVALALWRVPKRR